MSAASSRLLQCQILLVDDEEANLDLLEALLGSVGYTQLLRTTDARQVAGLVEAHRPDLILLDLHMPHRHGFEVLADLRATATPGEYRPVLVLTADVTPDTRDRALSLGARDFVIKPFDATEVLLRVENLLETRQLHVEERAARARAEEATRERERLLAVVAHDLRNPLAVVAMYAETLLRSGRLMTAEECEEAWERSALTTISANTVTMQRLVEDLLDASSMRGDGLRINRVARRVGDAFESARVMLSPLAEAAGVSLTFVGDEDAAEVIGAIDPERLVQLLSNLVGNAVKFTPSGGNVEVRFSVLGGALVASVTDTGPGIPPADIPHLFTAFWTGEQKVGARNGHGAGLGLWIARGIVEAHGGELEAESAPGAGATFRFRIPLS